MPRSLPPWHTPLSVHLKQHKSATMSLATIDPSTQTPRVRTLIFRGFLSTLPPNPHTPLPSHNPSCYTSALPTFTTDIRSHKPSELSANPETETVFWIEPTMNQWRIRGKCYLLSQTDTSASAVLEKWLVDTGEEADAERKEEWSWRKLVEAQWANLAPRMRGSFGGPEPGGERSGESGDRKRERVEDAEVLADREGVRSARANFRVGVVVPEVVERLDLAEDGGWGRRWVWELKDGEWVERELWP